MDRRIVWQLFFLIMFFTAHLEISLANSPKEGASPSAKPPQKENGTSIGFYTGARSKIYKSGEVPISFLPIVSFNYDGFYLRGLSLGYEWSQFYPKPYLEVTPNLLMLKANDGHSEGLTRRNWTLMGGGGLDFYLPYRAVFNVHIKVDLLGRYNSGYGTIALKRNFMPDPKIILNLSPFIRFYEKRYVDYYFGVSDSEVRSNRRRYEGKNGYEYGFQGYSMYFLTDKWMIHFLGSYSWMSREITNSPIVSRKNMYSGYIGITKKI